MSQRTDIENAIVAWLVAAGVDGGIPSPDSAVIIADQDAPRPPLPYLTVRLTSYGGKAGEDEELIDDSDPPLFTARGQRTGEVSINAYGDGAEDWLERAGFMLRYPSVKAILTAAGLNVEPIGEVRNLSALRSSHSENRFQQDFSVAYERTALPTDTEEAVELEVVQHTDDWEGSPNTRTVIVTENL